MIILEGFLSVTGFFFDATGEDDHVSNEDESRGTEDRDDDGQDDQELPVLLLMITLNY